MILAPVDEVRFYRNSAAVRRKATVSLQAGTTALLLSGISVSADPTSLRLFFSADVTGSDVQILPLRELLGNHIRKNLSHLRRSPVTYAF